MWGMLAGLALQEMQDASKREQQAVQAEIQGKYGPWLGANAPQGMTEHKGGDYMANGISNYMGAQDEKARRGDQNNQLFQLLMPKQQAQGGVVNTMADSGLGGMNMGGYMNPTMMMG